MPARRSSRRPAAGRQHSHTESTPCTALPCTLAAPALAASTFALQRLCRQGGLAALPGFDRNRALAAPAALAPPTGDTRQAALAEQVLAVVRHRLAAR